MAAVGSFLADMLAGGLHAGQQRAEQRRQLQSDITKFAAEQQLKSLFPDPVTEYLLRLLHPGSSAAPSNLPSGQATPSQTTPANSPTGLFPEGFTIKGMRFGMSPAQKGQEAAEKSLAQERAKAEANIPAAIRDLDTLHTQFDEAFPAKPGEEQVPAIQRAIGFSTKIGVKAGFPRPTPQQTGLLTSMPLAGIGLIRLAGALGKVTNLELQGAEQSLNQQGLSAKERFETARALSRQYIARIAPGDWSRISRDNPDLPSILEKYGITIPVQGDAASRQSLRRTVSAQAIKQRLLSR